MFSFSSDLLCGNGKLIEYAQKDGYEQITFIAEPKFGEPQPLWFYFRASGLQGGKTRFVMGNAHQFLRDAPDPACIERTSIVYREPGGEWKRGPYCDFTVDSGFAPESSFTLDDCPKAVEIAFCYPYTAETLGQTLAETGIYTESTIGYSTHGRAIKRLTAGGDAAGKCPGVYITCRQHAAEVGGAWILDGFMRYFASAEGRDKLPHLCLWIVPIVDVDGVAEGAYGKDQRLGDMNRSWVTRFAPRTEISAVIQDVGRWREQTRPFIYIDSHSPAHEVRGVQFNLYPNAPERHNAVKMSILEKASALLEARGYEPIKAGWQKVNYQGSAQGSRGMSHEYFRDVLDIPAIIAETSYEGPRGGGLYEIKDYRAYGAALAEALCETLEQQA